MDEKDKIVISTGHEPEEGLETPHFDAEETLLAARPVVPLTEDAIEAAHSARAKAARAPMTNTRFPMLALIIIAAVSVGLASGLAIGLYQGRQKATPVSAQPSSTTTTAADTQFKQKPAQEEIKTQLPSVQTVAETDTDQQGEPTALSQPEGDLTNEEVVETKARPEDSDTPKPEREAAPDKKRSDEKQTPPPAATRKKPQDDLRADDDDGNKRQRAARRRAIREQEDTYDDVPQRIERAGQELNRIREIFEGARP
jgi:hypothetical protein